MRIRELREQQKMSRQELASLLGINMETLARYERNEREPRSSLLKHIADILNVSADELMNGTGEEYANSVNP